MEQLPLSVQVVVGAVALILGPYAGIRVGLNGTRETVKRIEGKVDQLTTDLPAVRERVSVIEAIVRREQA